MPNALRAAEDGPRSILEVAETGVKIHTLTGDDLRQEHWDVFYKFYMDTSDRK